MTILELRGVEAGYGEMKILRGVSLSVPKGGLVAVIGPNGSGKSTTLKTIAGLLRPTAGHIDYRGNRIDGLAPQEIVRHGVAYVAQGRRTFPSMTVRENLEMGGFVLDDPAEARRRLRGVFEFFPALREKAGQRATFLSGGQQQMLAIGRALMLEPDLLMLDEPSLGLAPNTMVEIFRKIVEVNRSGTSILLVEQNARAALEIASHAYVLETGQVRLSGSGDEVRRNKDIKKLYLGELIEGD